MVSFAHDAQCVMCVIFDVIWILSCAGVFYPHEWIFLLHLCIFLVFYRECTECTECCVVIG